MEPQTNGPSNGNRFIDNFDADDPEYIREHQRPAVVKEDVRGMKLRQRVNLTLNSQAFREELEDIVASQIKSGPHPASLIALQQISELVLPKARFNQSVGGPMSKAGLAPILPIADVRGADASGYAKGEKLLRCKVASLFRLVDLQGWTHGIYNHISARVSQDEEHFLINPFGLLFNEITASTLVKCNMQGDVVDPGSTVLGVNRAGFLLHSAIHAARPTVRCIIHLHTQPAAAVSSMKCGLLPLSQEAMICGEVSYHDYQGILVDDDERETIRNDLGPSNKIMFLRNHGFVACGETVEEAWHYAWNCMVACETQVRALRAGLDNLITPSADIVRKVHEVGSQGGGGVNGIKEDAAIRWGTGQLEFEALMRWMDNCGYRTGYIYRQPVVKVDSIRKGFEEVEHPPAASGLTYVFDEEDAAKQQASLQNALEARKQAERAKWLNTPNTYEKIEIEETGTPNPKKIAKWKEAGGVTSPVKSTPIKVDANQFIPSNTDKKEFKNLQSSMKSERLKGKITSGPQSKILEGLTWEEAQKLQSDAIDGTLSGDQDHVVAFGAASKGIISRDQQHNVQVYRTYYAANPFDNVTDEDLEKYKQDIERKERGEPSPPPPCEPLPLKIEEQIPQKHVEERGQGDADVPQSPVSDEPDAGDEDKTATMRSTDSADIEGSPQKDVTAPASKEKKKKKGFRTPSFLKGKKKDKHKKEEGHE